MAGDPLTCVRCRITRHRLCWYHGKKPSGAFHESTRAPAAPGASQSRRQLLHRAVGRHEFHPPVDPQPGVLRPAVPAAGDVRHRCRHGRRCQQIAAGPHHPGDRAGRTPGRAVQRRSGQPRAGQGGGRQRCRGDTAARPAAGDRVGQGRQEDRARGAGAGQAAAVGLRLAARSGVGAAGPARVRQAAGGLQREHGPVAVPAGRTGRRGLPGPDGVGGA
ncbi:hypothetical protein G6F31_013222 [Rhizopus arrhizus]|nr:hypothetical protein G6F31_013222 [Rhizopus arrhizus]